MIPTNTYIGDQSNVVKNVSKSGMLVYGNPAKEYIRDFLPHNKVG